VPTLHGVLRDLPVGAVGQRSGSQVVSLMIGAPRPRHAARSRLRLSAPYGNPSNATRRYPLVYLLHGHPGSAVDWFRGAEAQQVMDTMLAGRLTQPMILVAADASGGYGALNRGQAACYTEVPGALHTWRGARRTPVLARLRQRAPRPLTGGNVPQTGSGRTDRPGPVALT
jgi:hypothetical protein